MNVIEALVVTFGMDATAYKRGAKEISEVDKKAKDEAAARAKEMEAGSKRMAEGISRVKIELLGLLATLGVSMGLKDFLSGQMNTQAALGRTAQNLDMNASRLKAWQLAAREMGGTAEDATASLSTLYQGLAEAKLYGHSSLTDTLMKYGIGTVGTDGKQLSPEELEQAISRRAGAMPRDLAQQMIRELNVGQGSMATLLLSQGLNQTIDDAEKLTAVTGTSVVEAERLQKAWVDLQQRFESIQTVAFNKLEPVLLRLGERLANWLDSVDWNNVATQLAAIATQINDAVQSMGGWKTVAEVVAALVGVKMVASFALLMRSLGAATAGFKGLGVMAAWAAASWIGGKINKAIEGTPVGDAVGTTVMSLKGLLPDSWGGKEARETISKVKWGELSTEQRQAQIAAFKLLLPNEKALLLDNMTDYQKHVVAGMPMPGGGGTRIPDSTGTQTTMPTGPLPDSMGTPEGNAKLFAALEYQKALPAGQLQAQFEAESNSGRNLISKAGAKGPFQFMDGTAGDFGLHGNDVYDLNKSAGAAAEYMARLLREFHGDDRKAIAAYNWGPGNVEAHPNENEWPAETQAYVNKVVASMAAQSRARAEGRAGNTSTSEVNIQQITVTTKATDAKGIAASLRPAITQQVGIVAQSDGGLQ